MHEDSGAVLRAEVGPLAMQLSGVVNLPEDIEQVVVSNFGRVESHLDDFGVASLVRAYVLVSWVYGLAAGIASGSIDHAGDFLKSGFDAPEASGSKSGKFSHSNLLRRIV